MRLRPRAFLFGLVLPVFLLLAFLYLSAFQLASEAWQDPNFNPMCPEVRSGYCVLLNYQPAQAIVAYEDGITLSTQGTVVYLHHVSEVCERWGGPISVSVYAPGGDYLQAKHVIHKMRTRVDCVRKWVSWHLVYDVAHPPSDLDMRTLANDNISDTINSSYIQSHRLVYPINVARNVARLNARTRYVLASDIELYPSRDIIPRFLDMIRRMQSLDREGFHDKRQVFVLPVFEVSENTNPPHTKANLVSLYKRKQAVSFHRYMCNTCHHIPHLDKWLKTNNTKTGIVSIFETTKRQTSLKLDSWEPFFIGTNREPLFDERLTWNGKINKMQLAYEMCLLDYDFHILDGAFLTHAPGIKIFSAKEQQPRAKYMTLNKKTYKVILQELHDKYGLHDDC